MMGVGVSINLARELSRMRHTFITSRIACVTVRILKYSMPKSLRTGSRTLSGHVSGQFVAQESLGVAVSHGCQHGCSRGKKCFVFLRRATVPDRSRQKSVSGSQKGEGGEGERNRPSPPAPLPQAGEGSKGPRSEVRGQASRKPLAETARTHRSSPETGEGSQSPSPPAPSHKLARGAGEKGRGCRKTCSRPLYRNS